MDDKKPYVEQKLNSTSFLRLFSKDTLSEELIWHRDKRNRIIKIIEGEGWEFQFDDTLPFKLREGDSLYIPANCYHRVKRGNTDLTIKITEVD